ncbi:MAG: hypothetical protein AAF561_13370 [Planctomycetota bacterium]
MPLLLPTILAVGVAVGVALLLVGLRGRRIDDHPLCRHCRRDLFGLAKTSRCPSCGRFSRSKLRGNRRRRPWIVALGLSLVLVGSLPPCLLLLEAVTQLDFGRAKPVDLLLFESRRSADAVNELARRRTRGDLSASELQRITSQFLADQEREDLHWVPQKGDWIVAELLESRLDQADQFRFLRAMYLPAIVTRRQVRGSAMLPVWIDLSALRGTSTWTGPSQFDGVLELRDTAGNVLTRLEAPVSKTQSGSWSRYWSKLPENSPVGDTELHLALATSGRESGEETADDLGTRALRTVEVVPTIEPVVRHVLDPKLANALRAGVRVVVRSGDDEEGLRVRPSGNDADRHLIASFAVDIEEVVKNGPVPAALAYRVSLVDRSGRRWRAGRWLMERGSDWPSTVITAKLPSGFGAEMVDVVFEPSTRLAELHPTISEILAERLVVEDVPIVFEETSNAG